MPIDYTVEARISYLSWLAEEDAAEEKEVRVLRDYASGMHPTYLTDRQKEYIGLEAENASHLYAHNLCHLVIASVVERMHVTGFQPVDADDALGVAFAEIAQRWWDQNRMDAQQDDLHECAVRDAESYLVVEWPDGAEAPKWTINKKFDGTQGVKLHRDPSTDEVLFASKRWQDWTPGGTGGKTRLTIYFPDRVERYVSARPGQGLKFNVRGEEWVEVNWQEYRDNPGDSWPIWWTDTDLPDGEPLGLAVIPFENPGGSEIAQLKSLQDALNKSDLDLLAAQDTSGFPILWGSGINPVMGASTGSESSITLSPGKMVRLTDPSARLGRIDGADLDRMINTSHYWIESAAGVTQTPHYMLKASGADQPSGESLKQQEAGLEAKCERKQRVWGNSYEDVMALSGKLWNKYRPSDAVEIARLQCQWASVATRNTLDDLTAAEKALAVGVPEEMIWQEFLEMDQEQVDRALEMIQAKRLREGQVGDFVFDRFNRGETEPEGAENAGNDSVAQ